MARWIRRLLTSVANSSRVMSEMANPSEYLRASLIAVLALRSDFGQTPARPPRAYRRKSLEVAPLFGRDRGRNDVSRDGAFPFEEIVDFVRFGVHWDEFRHWLAALGDYDGLALSLDLVHDREAICFEGTCGIFFMSTPLQLWSSYRGRISLS